MNESRGEAWELSGVHPALREPKRGRWIVAIVVIAIVIGMIVSLTGVWRVFQNGAVPPPLPTLELPAKPQGTPAGFAEQEPRWTSCGDGMQCADVYAPLDWEKPAGDTITLRLVKQEATSGTSLGTLFVNPGGPGASGADFVRNSIDFAVGEPLQAQYDVIGWDPRGVGASTPVRCLSPTDMDDYLFGTEADFADDTLQRGSDEWIDAAVKDSAKFGEACAEHTGKLLAHVDTMSTVHDLDMLRGIVGDDQLNYLGYSYGTYIGARYADAFPEKVGRFVLDGVLDPSTSEFDVVREQTRGFELALRAYAQSCLASADCPLTGSVDDAMAEIGALLDTVEATPLIGSDGRPVSSGTLLTAIITPLYSQQNWPYLNQLFASVQAGDADVALMLADSYFGRGDKGYDDNSTEAFAAINCLDYPNDLDPQRMREQAAELERVAPTIGRFQGYGDVSCAGWPFPGVEERSTVTAAGAAPILVVGTTGDPATPYRWAESLAKQLDSGTLLTYEGEGHTAYGDNACVNQAVEAYFLDGTLPHTGMRCR